MCTEKCFELTQRQPTAEPAEVAARDAGPASPAGRRCSAGRRWPPPRLWGTAQAGERAAERSPGRRHGLRDLTYPLTTSFPAFTPGEEAVRRTVVTIEDDGYYLQEWRIIEHIGTHVDAPGHFTVGGRLSPSCSRPSCSSRRWSSTSRTGRPATRTRS